MDAYAKLIYRPATLCEVCNNACGGCVWSKHGVQKPVPGWDAIRRDLSDSGESYIVLDCPKFELEEHNRWAYEKFDREKIREQYGADHFRETTKKEVASDVLMRPDGEEDA